jgi:hypothetical protein
MMQGASLFGQFATMHQLLKAYNKVSITHKLAKAYRNVEVKLYLFQTPALDGVEWSAVQSGRYCM